MSIFSSRKYTPHLPTFTRVCSPKLQFSTFII